MDGAISFDGIIGALILFLTPVFMFLITIVSFIANIGNRKSADGGFRWSKSFLYSGIVLLVFDLCFIAFFFAQGKRTLEKAEGVGFDQQMLMYWVPCHIAGYFLLSFAFRFYFKREENFKKFVEKLR